MRRSLVTLVLSLLLALMLAPVVSAGPVNILEVGEHQKSIDASETATFEWVVYNNDTSPRLVRVVTAVDAAAEEVTATTEESYATIYPGDHWTVRVTVGSARDAPTQWANVTVALEITRMDDLSQVTTEELTASVHITALFERSGHTIFGWKNDLPGPLSSVWGSFAIEVLIWLGIAAFIYFVVDPSIRMVTRRSKTELDDRLLRAVRMPLFVLIVTYGLVSSIDVLDISGEQRILIWQFYQIVLALNVSWMAYRVFDGIVIHYAQKWSSKTDSEIDDVLIPVLHKLGIIVIPLGGLVAALGVVGIDLTLLVASLGVMGLVIGLAAQQSLGNFFSGMLLLMDRPFKTGDIVKLDTGEICRVEKIGLRSTQLYNTFDHDIIILPNDLMANRKVENWSRPDKRHSQGTEVRVAYGTDLEKVHKILLSVADEHPLVIKEPGQMPYVRTARLGETAVDFKLWYWVALKDMWKVASDMRTMVEKRLREEGIEIPFPQAVVTFKNTPSEE